ncbi:glycoside hydrolase family 35 protein [Aaosphaeria arxii CBS 175.79]|uniref:Glycoside hydrolase family 35 protein n=1 Tax=Aaosphaeria arxii CBS 175.79 TaxID=1450172 RepID=A0A6A5XPQ4_9PLEO|nr:glycoside hydrolase family 35 protein [Aaosphaeria arxii CBS 175.79]KAF2014324.1 glycoside hydrolase family 35 protein [Aaosphaeria arxii CBS 175.79]
MAESNNGGDKLFIEHPRLIKHGSRWELLVDGRPYLILGGELQNSSMSSARYMDTVWENIAKLGVNTVLGPVSWEDVEPEEGRFDFTELDAVLASARAHGFRIVLIWFGSFKNGMSSYTPSWVKTNPQRFPRMETRNSEGDLEISSVISILHDECVQADAKAFARLMQHLKTTDIERTVIMVQVENEVGLLGDSRDRSQKAEHVFGSPVPKALLEFLRNAWPSLRPELKSKLSKFERSTDNFIHDISDTRAWKDTFGESIYTDEIFMAYHYTLYVEKVTAAGRQAYDIPLFTNVWLPKPGSTSSNDGIVSGGGKPGEYPSGGAVSRVLDIWHAFAPTLDFISPDIYIPDYSGICSVYCHGGQALFIPEQHRDEYDARRIWEALGRFGAIGASPFGIDTLDVETAGLRAHYELLNSVSSHIMKARLEPDSITGFFFDEIDANGTDPTPPLIRTLGSYELRISRASVFGQKGPGCGIVIALDQDRFLLIGAGYNIEFKSRVPSSIFTGILRFDEKSVVDEMGTLRTERRFNGDETRSGKWVNMPNKNPDLGGWIPISIPARTMIAEVVVYTLTEENLGSR